MDLVSCHIKPTKLVYTEILIREKLLQHVRGTDRHFYRAGIWNANTVPNTDFYNPVAQSIRMSH